MKEYENLLADATWETELCSTSWYRRHAPFLRPIQQSEVTQQ